MITKFFILIILSLYLERICASGKSDGQEAKRKEFIHVGLYHTCEGKDAANFTTYITSDRDQFCSNDDIKTTGHYLVQVLPNGQRSVNVLQILESRVNPSGEYDRGQFFRFVTSGALQGKYIYETGLYVDVHYLNKCSSILGLLLTPSKVAEIFILDKLDLNALLNPNGVYESFKKGSSTVCRGNVYHL